jgi:hypothetical protein
MYVSEPTVHESWTAGLVNFIQRGALLQLAGLRTASGELFLIACPRVSATRGLNGLRPSDWECSGIPLKLEDGLNGAPMAFVT